MVPHGSEQGTLKREDLSKNRRAGQKSVLRNALSLLLRKTLNSSNSTLRVPDGAGADNNQSDRRAAAPTAAPASRPGGARPAAQGN